MIRRTPNPDLAGYKGIIRSNPQLHALVNELVLVPVGSRAYFKHQRILEASPYSRYWFCERYKDYLDEKRANSRKLMRELARRNKKYSRYVYATYHD